MVKKYIKKSLKYYGNKTASVTQGSIQLCSIFTKYKNYIKLFGQIAVFPTSPFAVHSINDLHLVPQSPILNFFIF